MNGPQRSWRNTTITTTIITITGGIGVTATTIIIITTTTITTDIGLAPVPSFRPAWGKSLPFGDTMAVGDRQPAGTMAHDWARPSCRPHLDFAFPAGKVASAREGARGAP